MSPAAADAAPHAAAIDFVLTLGKALHRYGTPAHRLEEGLQVCCRRLGIEAEVFSSPTAIIMSFGEPRELKTRMLRVESGELDMGKLAQVDELADMVAAHKLTPAQGLVSLQAVLSSPPRFGHVVSTLAHGVTAGGLAVFFGGAVEDVAIAAAIGLAIGVLAQYARRSTDQARVFELIGAAFAALAAGVMSALWPALTPSLVTVSALITLLPGLSLVVAMTELATRNLIAGTARLMMAVSVLLELVVGVAVGERLARALVEVHRAVPEPLPEWARWGALGGSSLALAIVVQARPHAIPWIMGACATGYVGSRVGGAWLGIEMGVLIGAFALGVLGNVFARWRHRPAQIVVVPAMLLLVPGSLGFRGMTSLMHHDTLSGVEMVFAMFIVAIAIVAGLLIANAVVSPRRSL